MIETKELKEYFVNNEITKIFKDISFKRFYFLLTVLFNLRTNFDYTEYREDKDVTACIQILNYYDEKINSSLKDSKTQKFIETAKEIYSNFFSIPYFIRIKSRVGSLKNNLVILQCPCAYRNFYNFTNVIDTEFLIVPWKGYQKDSYMKLMKKLDEDNFNNYRYSYVMKLKDIFGLEVVKRDSITIKLANFKGLYYPYTFSQFRFPEWISTITYALKNLKKDGKLLLSLPPVNVTPAFKKVFEILCQYFEINYYGDYISNLDLGSLLIFDQFNDRVDDKTYQKLVEISVESLKYTYETCDYFNYMYSHPEVNFYIDKLNYKKSNKKVILVNDIDIKTTLTKKSEILINRIRIYFESQIDLIVSYINSNLTEGENGEININQDFFYSILYRKVIRYIGILHENKMSFSEAYLVYINKFNEQLITRLFNFKDSSYQLKQDITNYERPRGSYNINNFQIYTFKNLNKEQRILNREAQLKNRYVSILEEKKIPEILNDIFDEYKIGVPKYINKNLKLKHNISDSFTKIWEIYTTYPFLIRNKKVLNSYHFGDNPEESLYCTEYYISSRKRDSVINNWSGTCLREEFKDNYHYLKKNPNRWLFGSDKTGSITVSKNVEWYQKIFSSRNKLDLVVCDTNSDSKDITKFQRYEFSKLLMVLATSSKGTNCVIKHKLPFVPGVKNSEKGNGFFINLVYIYYYYFDEIKFYRPVSSSSENQEFYIIGNNFRGIEEKNFTEFINVLKNFKRNLCIYTKKSISEYFLYQINNFIKSLYDIAYRQYQTQVLLMSCLTSKDPKIKEETKCHLVLNKTYTDKIQQVKFKEWVKNFKLY